MPGRPRVSALMVPSFFVVRLEASTWDPLV